MKVSVNHDKYGQIDYEENFWTGKKVLAVGGQILKRKFKTVYTMNTENGAVDCQIK